MLRYKGGETCQKTIREGLAIHPVDDFGSRQVELVLESFFDGGWKLVLQDVSYQ